MILGQVRLWKLAYVQSDTDELQLKGTYFILDRIAKGLWSGLPEIQVEFPVGKIYFLKNIQTCSGNHPGTHAVIAGKSEVISPQLGQLESNLFSRLYIVLNWKNPEEQYFHYSITIIDMVYKSVSQPLWDRD